MSLKDELVSEILASVSLTGAAEKANAELNLIIGNRDNIGHIMQLATGLPKIKPSLVQKFTLILSQPKPLIGLSPFSIRCAFCSNIITYPAWYFNIRYTVNSFHYFICFDPSSNTKPTTRCYRR